jgi:hypothetical protein
MRNVRQSWELADERRIMPVLVWDRPGARVYETGLDRGVLYLPDGSAVPWNGLTAVIEKFDKTVTPVYYDGMKISDMVTLGDFAASMKAVTYPEEFSELEGVAPLRPGVYAGDQPPQTFGLCYRTQIGDDIAGDVSGYKIHILYNVTATPAEKTYASYTSDPSLVEFEWELTAIPEDVPGMRPTAHFILNSSELDPWLLEELEAMLYGSTHAAAALIPMPELVTYMTEWFRVKITDHGDGTWTAESSREGFIHMITEELFELTHVNAVYIDEETYILSDTLNASDVPQIAIEDHGNGTWSATSEHTGLIEVDEVAGTFTIYNANVTLAGEDSYRISDTVDD